MRALGAVCALKRGLVLFLIIFSLAARSASPPIDTSDPTAFFTNVASQLLQSELGLDLTHIQVYPTNQYTPVVHRLLQLTANIYDATTNRPGTGYPYLPSVFRPLFRRDSAGNVFIAGYREVVNDDLADARLAPLMVDLNSGSTYSIPLFGRPFGTDDFEPLVRGLPLIIGAKKGLPNFNEFSMQTYIFVARLLEFRRDPNQPPPHNPVVETNQMYMMAITNTFGLEAWNSYASAYPRDLQLIATAQMTAIMTNETGAVVLSNQFSQAAVLDIPQNTWAGWTNFYSAPNSFIQSWGTNNGFVFLTNSAYVDQSPWFVPYTHIFSRGAGFYVPVWWLTLQTRLVYILVDTNAHRIVDYVNLNCPDQALNISGKLMEGADCSTVSGSTYNNPASQWCTNRLRSSTDVNAPTYGILNQIGVGLNGTTSWNAFMRDLYAGPNAEQAVDSFRYNLNGWSPIYPQDQGVTFYRSNTFYAPLDPYRPIFVHISWQANDPLLHYTISDLSDLTLAESNRVNFASHYPPLDDLGILNRRFEPWGGSPRGPSSRSIEPFDPAAKDPSVSRPDLWDFPQGEPLDIGWIGRVHRGTPWQTVFLKSTNIFSANPLQRLQAWQMWLGVTDGHQAAAMSPTNDWRIASFLARIFGANDPHVLISVNQRSAADWAGVLDGLFALTNTAPFQFDTAVMSSNSPQAAIIASGLDAARAAQPAHVFNSVGDVFATPELSMASPWVNTNLTSISDQVYEAIPSQLLSILRPDPIGSVTISGSNLQVQFTGFDNYAYAVEASSNLVDWVSIGTSYPSNGLFNIIGPLPSSSATRFYRSRLLP